MLLFSFQYSGKFDLHKYKNTDILRLHALTYETMMENEEDQVNGVVHYVDAAGVTFQYLTLFTPREAVRIAKNGEVRDLFDLT